MNPIHAASKFSSAPTGADASLPEAAMAVRAGHSHAGISEPRGMPGTHLLPGAVGRAGM